MHDHQPWPHQLLGIPLTDLLSLTCRPVEGLRRVCVWGGCPSLLDYAGCAHRLQLPGVPKHGSKSQPPYTHRLCLQIIMFELFAGEVAFQGANLGHLIFQIGKLLSCAPAAVIVNYYTILSRFITTPFFRRQGIIVRDAVHKRERPPIPADCPADYTELMQRCWQNDAALRPTFKDVLASLQAQFSVLRAARPKRGPATPGPPAAPAASPAPGPKPC